MKLSLIAAMSRNNVIGKDNQLPWRLPADLQHFKTLTMGKPIVMGRKTFESIGKALPGRRNIVISRDKNFHADGCGVFHSLEDALVSLKNVNEVMIIGGANLYAQTLAHADCIYLTVIDADFEGDTYFPEINWSEWQLISDETFSPDEKNKFPYRFETWEKTCAQKR